MFTLSRLSLSVCTTVLALISWLAGGARQVQAPAHSGFAAAKAAAHTVGGVSSGSGRAAGSSSGTASSGTASSGTASSGTTTPPTKTTSAVDPTEPTSAPTSSAVHVPVLGDYAGPDSKGVTGAQVFGAFAGSAPGTVLDFAGTDTWANIAGPNWLLNPWVGNPARLEYSLPMMPNGSQYSLAACASGSYNVYWKQTAQSLINHDQADGIVRPGWEFNGTWYHWSAKNEIASYVGCFKQIVTTMRSAAGQHFAFDWNPSLGSNAFPAEQAYPGDAYVDYVGIDIYDTSWSHYPSSNLAAAQAAAWNDDLNGNHGLAFWSTFTASHHKAMAITEWGVSHQTDGHGGNDDPAFVDHMFDFMTDPANNVAYGHYFDWASSVGDHKLTGTTEFPSSAAEYQKRSKALTSK